LIDFQNPKKQYSVVNFQKSAQKLIAQITHKQKLPILCGGTGHWIDAVVFNQSLPQVKPNLKLRKNLEKLEANELFAKLINLDPQRAQTIDRFNKRRLIRALEIIFTTGQPVPVLSKNYKQLSKNHSALWLGLKLPKNLLYKKIKTRLQQRLKAGMVKEVKKLKQQGLSWQRLESFGLEYRYISRYLRGKINYEEMFNGLLLAIQHYTKRQMTWWKKNPAIHWLKPPTPNTDKLILKFLKS
jgi:tRNA dimethylallyltransferase